MIFGWGLFNLVEGIIDHHILHIRHVTETANHLIWNLAFLASGVVMILIGWWIIGRAPLASTPILTRRELALIFEPNDLEA